MSVPALRQRLPVEETGLTRSARLMRALGAGSGPIWAELSPEEAARLTAAMEMLAPETGNQDNAAADDFLTARSAGGQHVQSDQADIWQQLSGLDPAQLIKMLRHEHPQVLALVLSRLVPDVAARTLRLLPAPVALDALRRLLHLGPARPEALGSIEQALGVLLAQVRQTGDQDGHERIARIFDNLDGRSEQMFLAALENAEPGAGERVRALMFTFDDLAQLDAAGMQTLLSSADRGALILALKGAKPVTAEAFFINMTQRAGAFLRDEIGALGAVRRSEIDEARAEILTLARKLIQRGDVRLSGESDEADELVE